MQARIRNPVTHDLPSDDGGKNATKKKTVGFITFESEFAPLGGLAAVMRFLPKRMAEVEGWESFTMAPFFRAITRCKQHVYDAIVSTGKTFSVPYGSDVHSAEVFQFVDDRGFHTFLIDSPDFFNAPCDCGDPPHPATPCNPYVDPLKPRQLLEDSLLFCAAVPKALGALGYTRDLVLNLQDWETACVALTTKEEPGLQAPACVLTLHNSYDQPVSETDFQKISKRSLIGSTVLSKMIPFVEPPLCTVSKQFAQELVTESVHTKAYAPHLQAAFKRKKILGINNGLFGKLDFPEAARTAADSGHIQGLLDAKQERRQAMIDILQEYRPERAWGELEWKEFDGPVFLFLGRDDPRQKGYDLAAAAIQRIPPGEAKYIFTPIPGDEGVDGLGFLRKLAEQRPGEVKIFPFRMARGFIELQKGASFLAMCSFYEPFGAATEGYAVGTPVVARATGGLVQQVVPFPSASLSDSVRRLTHAFHTDHDPPTGFLFRERRLSPVKMKDGWRKILDCAYWPDGDRLQERLRIPLFDAMVTAASQAFRDAIEVFTHDQASYADMINAGFRMLEHFSWDIAVREYDPVFQSALSVPQISSLTTAKQQSTKLSQRLRRAGV